MVTYSREQAMFPFGFHFASVDNDAKALHGSY